MMKKLFVIWTIVLSSIMGTNAQTLFYEGFDSGTLPTGWTVIDADEDGYGWDATYLFQDTSATHSGDGVIASASWNSVAGPLFPDNWLISPAVSLTGNCHLSFWVCPIAYITLCETQRAPYKCRAATAVRLCINYKFPHYGHGVFIRKNFLFLHHTNP